MDSGHQTAHYCSGGACMDTFTCNKCGSKVINTQSGSCPKCGGKLRCKGMNINAHKHIVSIIGIIIIGVLVSVAISESAPQPKLISMPPDAIQQALHDLTISHISWYKGYIDGVVFVDIIAKNQGKIDVNYLELTCDHFANRGARVGRITQVVNQVVPAGKSKTFTILDKDFINSKANRVICSITNLALK